MLESYLLVLDRQDRFKGDLNIVQRVGLYWIINHEIKENVDIEIARLKHQALATNMSTSPEYIKNLFAEEQEDEPDEDAEVIDVGEWETPQTPQDLEQLLKRFNAQRGESSQQEL